MFDVTIAHSDIARARAPGDVLNEMNQFGHSLEAVNSHS